MKINLNLLWTGLLSVMLLTGCGPTKEEEEKKEGESVSALGAISAVKEMTAQAAEMSKKGPTETIDFRKLKEMLPADADGLPRKEATGEKNGAGGYNVSTAEGKYGNEDGSETIELTIVDAGGGPMMIGMAAWSMIDIDKETENGYEKTSKMGDNKSYEKYDNKDKNGEVALLVNKRFIITAEGRGVSMDKIKATIEDIDLDKLSALK